MVYVSRRLLRRVEDKLLEEGTFVPSEDVGAPSGVAPLDSGGMVPMETLPPVDSSGFSGIGMPLESGDYALLNPGNSASSGVSAAIGYVTAFPLYIPTALQISEFIVEITQAGVGATMKLGIYERDDAGQLVRIHTFGTVDASLVGRHILAGNWELPAGVMWIGMIRQGAAFWARVTSLPLSPPPGSWHVASSDATVSDNRLVLGPGGLTELPASFPMPGLNYGGHPVPRCVVKLIQPL